MPGGGKDLLALAQEAGRLGIFEWLPPEGKVRLSDGLQALYGISASVGTVGGTVNGTFASWLDCVFREDGVRVSNLIETALAERAIEINCDFRIRRGDDRSVRWIQARNTVVYDAAGQAERVVGGHVDVTEQKRAIVQLRAFTESLGAPPVARSAGLAADRCRAGARPTGPRDGGGGGAAGSGADRASIETANSAAIPATRSSTMAVWTSAST